MKKIIISLVSTLLFSWTIGLDPFSLRFRIPYLGQWFMFFWVPPYVVFWYICIPLMAYYIHGWSWKIIKTTSRSLLLLVISWNLVFWSHFGVYKPYGFVSVIMFLGAIGWFSFVLLSTHWALFLWSKEKIWNYLYSIIPMWLIYFFTINFFGHAINWSIYWFCFYLLFVCPYLFMFSIGKPSTLSRKVQFSILLAFIVCTYVLFYALNGNTYSLSCC
jgi:hypothetical protein